MIMEVGEVPFQFQKFAFSLLPTIYSYLFLGLLFVMLLSASLGFPWAKPIWKHMAACNADFVIVALERERCCDRKRERERKRVWRHSYLNTVSPVFQLLLDKIKNLSKPRRMKRKTKPKHTCPRFTIRFLVNNKQTTCSPICSCFCFIFACPISILSALKWITVKRL